MHFDHFCTTTSNAPSTSGTQAGRCTGVTADAGRPIVSALTTSNGADAAFWKYYGQELRQLMHLCPTYEAYIE
jgi:hypothetical protein